MNKKQYLDLLRYYFRKANKADLEEIIYDYEEHFRMGVEQGLSEEEIARSLGSPSDIYEAYMSEGIRSERKGLLKGNLEEMVERAQESYKTNIEPQLPGLFKSVSTTALVISAWVAYFVAAMLWIFVPFLVVVLALVFDITLAGQSSAVSLSTIISGVGFFFFSGLSFFFIGKELIKLKHVYDAKEVV